MVIKILMPGKDMLYILTDRYNTHFTQRVIQEIQAGCCMAHGLASVLYDWDGSEIHRFIFRVAYFFKLNIFSKVYNLVASSKGDLPQASTKAIQSLQISCLIEHTCSL